MSIEHYQALEHKGNVYQLDKLEHTMTSFELLREYFNEARQSGETHLTLNDFEMLMDFGFEKTQDGGVYRPASKVNCFRLFQYHSRYLSQKYFEQFKTSAPRFKQIISTKDFLNGKSGMKNCYPESYIEYTREFILKYPFESWPRITHARLPTKYDDKVISCDTTTRVTCVICKVELERKSLKAHFKSKSHCSNEKEK